MDSAAPTTTRKQLQGYGASRYLAGRLTASITPVAKSGNAYVYALDQVVTAIREYASKARIQATTQQVLAQMTTQMMALLDNVVPIAPNGSTTEVSGVTRQLLRQMHRTDKAMAEMKATVASIGQRTS